MGEGKKRFYAYLLTESGVDGVVESWSACESCVSGRKARYRGFPTFQEARAWLDEGADYGDRKEKKRLRQQDLPLDAIFFDSGTGRGLGTEINVTDRDGVPLLHLVAPAERLTERGTIVLTATRTNNYGELVACLYALRAARKLGRKRVMGDSALVLDYWSKGHLSAERRASDPDLLKVAGLCAAERRAFEAGGGVMEHVSGGINPADLGFHKD